MNAVTSLMQNLSDKKKSLRRNGRPVQEEWCQGIVSRPEEKFIVPSVVDGNIVGYKAIFVAWCFSRREGIVYEETSTTNRSEVTWHA